MTERGDASDAISELPTVTIPSTDPEALLEDCVVDIRDKATEKSENDNSASKGTHVRSFASSTHLSFE